MLDDIAVNATLALSATQPISGAQLAINQRLELKRVGAERTAAFDGLITDYVRALRVPARLQATASSAALTHVEDFAAIAEARRDLRLILAFSASFGASGAGRRLFVPIVSK